MEHKDLFERIKETSENGSINPSSNVWNKLEQRLNKEIKVIEPSVSKFSSFYRLGIAASVLMVIGAYALLNNLGNTSDKQSAIKLENLHTIEVNPRFNIQMAGESATIPSVRLIRSTPELYNSTIKEGSSEKKLVIKKISSKGQEEYGLG